MQPHWRFPERRRGDPQAPAPDTRTLIVRQRTRHVRFNKTRSHNIDSNTTGRNFTRQ